MKILSPKSDLIKNISKKILDNYVNVSIIDASDEIEVQNDKTIFISQNLESAQVVDLLIRKRCSHLLQMNESHFLEDLERTAALLENPKEYFSSQGQCLLKSARKSHMIEFSNPSDKERLKNECSDFVIKAKGALIAESLDAIVEELYMNAAFDAPRLRQNEKNHPYIDGCKAKIVLMLSDYHLLVSCYDPYGTLDMMKFVERMNEVYKKGAGNVLNMKKGAGAGIGCTVLFEHSTNFFLGVIPGQATVVTCLLRTGISAKHRAQLKKSLHLIRI